MGALEGQGGFARALVGFFVRRRPLVHTLTLLFVIVGTLSYLRLPQEIFPPIATNKIEIRASYPGTSANDFDDIITSRIEDKVRNIDGVKMVESVTRDGSCLVTVTLEDGTEIVDALFRVRDAIDLVKPDFPEDMDDPAIARKIEKYPLLTLSISGGPEPLLQQVAEHVKDEIEAMANISSASINGKADQEIHIFLDSGRIEALGLTPAQVVSAIKAFVNNSPLGEIKQRGNHVFVTTPGGPHALETWRNLIIKIGDKRLFLSRIARIEQELSEVRSLSHFNGKQNISLTVFKTAQGSSIDLSRQIRQRLADWEKAWPGLHFSVYSDLSVYIKNRLNTVKSSAVVGLILVSVTLYLFLNWRVSLSVLIGIPTAFLMAFVYLAYLDETINMLSLFSFLMALGIVVDDAIVIGENIFRHMEAGLDRVEAAIKGTEEMFWPICAATFTTVVAFLPLLMLGGDIGKFLSIIPIFVSTVLLASLFESLAILPVHGIELYRRGVRKSPLSNWEPARRLYRRVLSRLLDHPRITLAAGLLVLLASLLAAKLFLSFTLLPAFDTDQIYIRGKLGAEHGIRDTEEVVFEVERRVRQVLSPDDLDSIATHIGTSFNDKMEFDIGEDLFQVFVNLKKPAPQNWLERWVYPVVMFGAYESGTRRHTAMELVKVLERELSDIEIQRLTVTKPKAGIVRADVEISLSWPPESDRQEMEPVYRMALRLEEALASIPGVENIADNYDPGKIQLELRINRRGKELGFTEEILAANLIPYYLNPKTARIMKGVRDDMVVRTYLEGRDEIQRFRSIRLKVPETERLVYLHQICDIVPKRGMARIWKENGIREITVTASLDKALITSRQVMERISPVLDEIRAAGFRVALKGEKKVADRTLRDLEIAATVAVLGIFIVLLLQFNSFKDSLVVLMSVPLAFTGVVAGHIVMGKHLAIPSFLGFVGLAGVAVNDAIIMVDFLRRHTSRRQDRKGFLEAASMRLRPVMLTSFTTIMSLVPLIFFATGQALILSPMAVSFGYGLMAATLANLLMVPVAYMVVHGKKI